MKLRLTKQQIHYGFLKIGLKTYSVEITALKWT
jgi:hypothetical protein